MKLIIVFVFISLQCFNLCNVSGWNTSKEKCNVYGKMLPHAFKKFPFMATITNGKHIQRGILISDNFVLAIASDDRFGKKFATFVNSYCGTKQCFDIIEESVHPQYSSDKNMDLKLFKLNDSVKFNDYIRPACLSQPESTIPQQLLEIGWSATNNRLHKLKLNYIPNAVCNETCKSDANCRNSFSNINKETIFCATANEEDRHKCAVLQGYGGAAVLSSDGNMSTLSEVIAIVKKKHKCDDDGTVFVRLSASLSWIESVVWPNETESTSTTITSTWPSDYESTETEQTFNWSGDYESTTTATTSTGPSENVSTTAEKSSRRSDDSRIMLTRIGHELYEIQKFLNVNLVVLVLLIMFVLCIACILWSDGLYVRKLLPNQSSISTEV